MVCRNSKFNLIVFKKLKTKIWKYEHKNPMLIRKKHTKLREKQWPKQKHSSPSLFRSDVWLLKVAKT